jgi:hypothetical protein
VLSGHHEVELVEAAELGQVRASEPCMRGSVRHVEVFRMDSVRTSILGDLDAYPGTDAPAAATPSTVKSAHAGVVTRSSSSV